MLYVICYIYITYNIYIYDGNRIAKNNDNNNNRVPGAAGGPENSIAAISLHTLRGGRNGEPQNVQLKTPRLQMGAVGLQMGTPRIQRGGGEDANGTPDGRR